MTGHGLTDRILHLALLSSRRFRRFQFDSECQRRKSTASPERQNLFVCGLARAGSTALTRSLYAGGQFTATTYTMLPLLLSPSWSRQLERLPRRRGERGERSHRDGIHIDIDSVEALDGLFWSTFFPAAAPVQRPRAVPGELLRQYACFIENLLAAYGGERYLAKMNQSIDKLAALASYFQRSLFLVPFRQPLAQAGSLLRQQQNFARLSWYERRYFGWLEHHEFGALHRPFVAGEAPAPAIDDLDRLDYWLRRWLDAYHYLSGLVDEHEQLLPLRYETLAQDCDRLGQARGLAIATAQLVNRNRDTESLRDACDPQLLWECEQVYARLTSQVEQRL
ncbi:MAG: sulfotransferase [Gammaproteobacteria bacterium]|nr:sulfotransferase [Gammaproteobacteria bacterium]